MRPALIALFAVAILAVPATAARGNSASYFVEFYGQLPDAPSGYPQALIKVQRTKGGRVPDTIAVVVRGGDGTFITAIIPGGGYQEVAVEVRQGTCRVWVSPVDDPERMLSNVTGFFIPE